MLKFLPKSGKAGEGRARDRTGREGNALARRRQRKYRSSVSAKLLFGHGKEGNARLKGGEGLPEAVDLGGHNGVLVVGVLEVEVFGLEGVYLLENPRLLHHRPLLLGLGVGHLVLELLVEVLVDEDVVGGVPPQFGTAGLTILEPKMGPGLAEGHPLVDLLEELADKGLELGAELGPPGVGEIKLSLKNVGDCLGVVLRLEGSVAGYDPVDGNPESPEVDALVVAPAEVDLGRQVEVGANDGEHVPPGPAQEGLFRDPEVDDLDAFLPRVEKDVLGLDVPVADVAVVEVLDGLQQLGADEPELPLGLGPVLLQGGEGQVLHDQEGHPLGLVKVQPLVLADVVAVQLLQGDEVLPQLLHLLLLHLYLLHRVGTFACPVEAAVDTGVAAFPQFLLQLKILLKQVVSLLLLYHLTYWGFSLENSVIAEAVGAGGVAQLPLPHFLGFLLKFIGPLGDQGQLFEGVPQEPHPLRTALGQCIGLLSLHFILTNQRFTIKLRRLNDLFKFISFPA